MDDYRHLLSFLDAVKFEFRILQSILLSPT